MNELGKRKEIAMNRIVRATFPKLLLNKVKLATAKVGPDGAIDAIARDGYFERNHAERAPLYEQPRTIHGPKSENSKRSSSERSGW